MQRGKKCVGNLPFAQNRLVLQDQSMLHLDFFGLAWGLGLMTALLAQR